MFSVVLNKIYQTKMSDSIYILVTDVNIGKGREAFNLRRSFAFKEESHPVSTRVIY